MTTEVKRSEVAEGVLVDAGWLAAHLDDPGIRVVEVDVSPKSYDDWHIPGAVLWNVYKDLKDADYHTVDSTALERVVRRSGIEPDSTVVFYGYAPAFGLWLLRLHGHRDTRILDCSRQAWWAAGHPRSTDPVHPAASRYGLPPVEPHLRATHGAVRDATDRGGTQILDVRSEAEYRGERFWPSGGMEPGGRAGHVPSAVHQPIDGLYDESGAFRSAVELRKVFDRIDAESDTKLITYCTIGGRAATAWFVLTQLLGHRRVKVYDGSWAEWGRMPEMPVETADRHAHQVHDAAATTSGGTEMTAESQIDQAKLESFAMKAIGDVGALMSSALVVIGDRLNLYRAMAASGPVTSAELAERTGTVERYVREWLVNQAASGYVDYDPAGGRYSLPAEHAVALTDDSHPFFLAGAYQASLALVKSEAKIGEAFRTGKGLSWADHDTELFPGAERVWKPGYQANLVSSWIPALEGVEAKLEAGAKVADVGCGHGASTLILAEAYPNSRVTGYDNHAPSVEHARRAAVEAGLADRVTFQTADANSFPGQDYDLIAFFDSFHDLGDPLGAARRVRSALAPDGTLMLVEPMAGQRVEENLNPVGRVFSGFSVLCCTPNAIASCGCDEALGTIASDEDLRNVLIRAGFTRFRRAVEAPFNRVFEIRP